MVISFYTFLVSRLVSSCHVVFIEGADLVDLDYVTSVYLYSDTVLKIYTVFHAILLYNLHFDVRDRPSVIEGA